MSGVSQSSGHKAPHNEPQKCFVAHSYQAEWHDTIEAVCNELLPEYGLQPWYAEYNYDPTTTLRDKVVSMIDSAPYGIYDLSYWRAKEHDPWVMPCNVLIELGIAIALNRPTLLLRHTGNRLAKLELPKSIQSVTQIREFSGDYSLENALREHLSRQANLPTDSDWQHHRCRFGEINCSYIPVYPHTAMITHDKLHCHIADGPDADQLDFRRTIEAVLSKFNNISYSYLDKGNVPRGYTFLLCSHCQLIRSTPFAIYRITPDTLPDTYIAIGISIGLEYRFHYKIPRFLITKDMQHMPSLLQGYQFVPMKSLHTLKTTLPQFVRQVLKKIDEPAYWRPQDLPFETRIPLGSGASYKNEPEPSQEKAYPENTYPSGTPSPTPSVNLPLEQPLQSETGHKDAEQNLMTALEELEQSLQAKGFVRLEPNALSTLAAQTEESSIPSHDLDTVKAAEGYEAQGFQQATQQEPQEAFGTQSISSALAQLGNFANEPQPPTTPLLASSFEMSNQNEEPSWLQALKNIPSPTVLATPSNDLVPPVEKEPQQIAQSLAMQGNPLLENELNTTMRRPAVRLQPLQNQTSLSQRAEQSHTVSRSQGRERIEPATPMTKPTHENLSYQDRLGKGYQHQLVGSYDEAMQEYRFIIRGATDLLPEVISHLRALLKLAPNYAAGYRVLGDAYMRQGEYLQAMEVYNKALTMTKKVKTNGNGSLENDYSRQENHYKKNLSSQDRLGKGYQHQLVGNYNEAMREYRFIIRDTTDLLPEVISNVRALLKLAPNYTAGYRVLGDAYMRQGEPLQAMEAYNKALTMTKKVKGQT